MAARPAHHAGHCYRDDYFLCLARQTARYAPSAARLLPVVSRHDLRVYAAGYVDEEDLRVEVRGAAEGGWTRGGLTAPREVGYGGSFAIVSLFTLYTKFISYIWSYAKGGLN